MKTSSIERTPPGWKRREAVILIQYKPTIQWKRARINPFTDTKDCAKLITFSSAEESNAWIRWWFS